jgi:hypothetical protein
VSWGAWAALLVASHGATLVLQRAGKTVAYQHWAFERLQSPVGWIAIAVLLVQCVAILRSRRALFGIIREFAGGARPWQFVGLLGSLFVLAAMPSSDPRRYAAEIVVGFGVQLLAVANVALLLASMPREGWARIRAWFQPGSEDASTVAIGLIALGVVLVTWSLAAVVYERVPHVPDEVVYLLQARYFAAGRIDLPAPPVPGGFDVDLMYYDDGRWFSSVPPGWPAVLAIGVRLGVPWLVNPVLSGICVVLLYVLARRVDSERTARLSAVLLAASPWFLFLGMSLMTHAASLAFALAAAVGVAEARRRGSLLPAGLAGIAVGMVSLIRPLEGLTLAVILGLWSLGARGGSGVWRFAPSAALTVATVVVGAVVRWYNAALTGSASRFPIMMYNDKYYVPGANDLGFGANRGMGWGGLDPWPGHGVRDVALNSLLNGVGVQTELFGWAMGSLTLIVALVWLRRLSRLDLGLLAVAAFVAGIHALYWFSGGPDFGARYWYLAIVPLVLLTARAGQVPFPRATGPGVAVGIVVLTALSTSTFGVWRAVEKYAGYRRMDGTFLEFEHRGLPRGVANPLVLIRGGRHPDFHMAANRNPLDLRSATGPVYAWDRTPVIRRRVVAAFPERPVFIVDGPTVSGRGYRVVAGPLPPGSLAPDIPSSEALPEVAGRRSAQGMQRAPEK